MSPGVRTRLWRGFHEAALREPEGSPHKVRFKAAAHLLAYGGGLQAVAASLHRLTSRKAPVQSACPQSITFP